MNFDILYLISLKLNDKDLLSLGATNKYFYERICQRDRIWLDKLKNYDTYKFERLNKSPKELYNILKGITVVNKSFGCIGDLWYLYNKKAINLDFYEIIEEIPREISNLINLESLSLSFNKITKIPKEISKLINLQFLNLSNNQIKEIPKEICDLYNLEFLRISDNQITQIPKEIGKMTSLKELNLSFNKITKIPKEIANLTKLKSLNLEYNKITSIPKEINLDILKLTLEKNDILEFEN